MIESLDKKPMPGPFTITLWAGYIYGFLVHGGYVTVDEINLIQNKYKAVNL